MRQITKGPEPVEFTRWKAQNRGLASFCYDSVDSALRKAIRDALVAEQRGLCAYTGRRIEIDTCHIEHLRPQNPDDENVNGVVPEDHSDIEYGNMIAGVPASNAPRLSYGAHLKDNWPSSAEMHLFVSPLTRGCDGRFSFHLNGGVESRNVDDLAAKTTIQRLGLNVSALVELRKAAIDATLQMRRRGRGSLKISEARRRLRTFESAEQQPGKLEPFSFALAQALEAHIRRIEKIREGRGRT